MMAFGWTIEYVDELDLVQVSSLYKGLSKKPPVHWCAAAFVKFKPAPGSEAAAGTAPGAKPSDLFSSMGGRMLDG
jgi:hypothetical protein